MRNTDLLFWGGHISARLHRNDHSFVVLALSVVGMERSMAVVSKRRKEGREGGKEEKQQEKREGTKFKDIYPRARKRRRRRRRRTTRIRGIGKSKTDRSLHFVIKALALW